MVSRTKLNLSHNLTTAQVAAQIGRSRRTVQRLRKSGKLPATRSGQGGIRYDQAEVDRYRREHGSTYKRDESASVTPLDSLQVTAQRNPRRLSYLSACHSPTESLGSRQGWGKHERWLLRGVHAIAEPTHFATLQWRGIVGPGELRRFDRGFAQSVRRFVHRSGLSFGFYAVKELNDYNRVHCHVLIRSDVPASEIGEVLSRLVRDASSERAIVTHCDPIQNLRAVERYVVKDLKADRLRAKPVRLFEPGCVRHRTVSGYFPSGWSVPSLREAGRTLCLRELQANRRRLPTWQPTVRHDGGSQLAATQSPHVGHHF